MKVLIQKARIIDPHSPFHETDQDIFINNGVIEQIGNNLQITADHTINHPNLHCSPGWVDVFANFNDP